MQGRPLLAVTLLAVTLPGSVSGMGPRQAGTYTDAGLTVELPSGWRVVHRRLTPCVDPVERLTVAGHGALVMLQERLEPKVHEFARRPSRFGLSGRPQPIECCAPARRPGWISSFRDGGRGFYVYVYLGEPGTRGQALSIVDSLRVQPRF